MRGVQLDGRSSYHQLLANVLRYSHAQTTGSYITRHHPSPGLDEYEASTSTVRGITIEETNYDMFDAWNTIEI